MVPVLFKVVRRKPVEKLILPGGSYLAVLEKAGYPTVKVPFNIKFAEKLNLRLRMPEKKHQGMIFVNAGTFRMGGENSGIHRIHDMYLDSFYIKTYEVTIKEYLEFWRSLTDKNLKDKYRAKVLLSSADTSFTYLWDENGKMNKPFLENRPVTGVSHQAVVAYCRWLSGKLGCSCRLPTAAEWEKAARGVDARKFPWGNGFRPEFAFIYNNKAAHEKFGNWAPPGFFPVDKSIYDVYDMGGNVREMTSSRFPGNSRFFQVKGASSATTERFLYCAYASDTPAIPTDVGFRYVIDCKCIKKGISHEPQID